MRSHENKKDWQRGFWAVRRNAEPITDFSKRDRHVAKRRNGGSAGALRWSVRRWKKRRHREAALKRAGAGVKGARRRAPRVGHLHRRARNCSVGQAIKPGSTPVGAANSPKPQGDRNRLNARLRSELPLRARANETYSPPARAADNLLREPRQPYLKGGSLNVRNFRECNLSPSARSSSTA